MDGAAVRRGGDASGQAWMRPPVRSCGGRRAGVLVMLLACAACAVAPRTYQIADLPARPVYDAEWIRGDRAAAAVAMAVMADELGLPRLDAALHVLPDRDAFRLALLDNGYGPAFAAQTASAVDAVAGPGLVFVNGAALARLSYPVRAGFFAHELTHTLQYALGGGVRGTSDQWLREGFADWVGGRVLDATGAVRLETFREQRLQMWRQGGELPLLAQLTTFPDWIAQMSATPPAALPALAYLAVEYLVERHGVDAVLDYFARFATSQDRLGHFLAAFGEPFQTFEAAAEAYLRRLR